MAPLPRRAGHRHAPVMQQTEGAWVGWPGGHREELDPFENDGMHLIPVSLNADDLEEYYEGFSNATLWPLYHDVIVPPEYHRTWWDALQDGQPALRRGHRRRWPHRAPWSGCRTTSCSWCPSCCASSRPDLRIGFFNHIPFPPLELFFQLPWRRQMIEGLLGADLVGFQRAADASNFLRCVRRFTDRRLKGQAGPMSEPPGRSATSNICGPGAFPISIDSRAGSTSWPATRRSLPAPQQIRQDSATRTGAARRRPAGLHQGHRHRLKAYGELLADGRLTSATPCWSRSPRPAASASDATSSCATHRAAWSAASTATTAHGHTADPLPAPRPTRGGDGRALPGGRRHAGDPAARRHEPGRQGVRGRPHDDRGALVLSEFTGAADELTQALLVNPHDIDGLKARDPARGAHGPGRGHPPDAGHAPAAPAERRRALVRSFLKARLRARGHP